MKLNIFWIIILISRINSLVTLEQTCPDICSCDIFMELNRADCSYQNLIDSNTEVPKNVEILDLSHNKISTIENDSLNPFKYLVELHLSHNYIQTIFLEAFENLKKLTYINLSYNRIEDLDNRIFIENVALVELDLSGNKFMSFSDKPLIISDSLKNLYLRDSKISDLFPSTFSKIPKLLELDLSENLLITLNVEAIANMPSLKSINAKFNSWKCDDKGIESSKKWLTRNRINVDLDICKKSHNMFEKMQDYRVDKKSGNIVVWKDLSEIPTNESLCDNYMDKTCVSLIKCQKTKEELEMKSKDYNAFDNILIIFLIHVSIFLFFCGAIIGGSVVYCILINRVYKKSRPNSDTSLELPSRVVIDTVTPNNPSVPQRTVMRRNRSRSGRNRYHQYRNSTVFFIANLFNRQNGRNSHRSGTEVLQLLDAYNPLNDVSSNSIRVESSNVNHEQQIIPNEIESTSLAASTMSSIIPSAPELKRGDTPPPPYAECLD